MVRKLYNDKRGDVFERLGLNSERHDDTTETKRLVDEALNLQEGATAPASSTEPHGQATDALAEIFNSESIRGHRRRGTRTTALKIPIDVDIHRKAIDKAGDTGVNLSRLVEEVLKVWVADDR